MLNSPARHTWHLDRVRLPRGLDADSTGPRLLRALRQHARELWPGGSIQVPTAPWGTRLEQGLAEAAHAGHLVRGLEQSQKTLAREARGISMVDARSGTQRGSRVSRLVLASNDGSERFYRQLERLVIGQGPRVLAVRLEADSSRLGELVGNAPGVVRAVLVEHKTSVARVLSALYDHDST